MASELAKWRRRRTLDLDDLDGAVLVAETEELEVAVLRLLRLGVTVDLDAKVVAVRLPVDLALRSRARVSFPAQSRKRERQRRTSWTLKRFFERRVVRLGRVMSVTRAGWLATSGGPEGDDVLPDGRAGLLLVRLAFRVAAALGLELVALLVVERGPLKEIGRASCRERVS